MVSYLGRVDGVERRRSVRAVRGGAAAQVAGPLPGRWRVSHRSARGKRAAGIYVRPLHTAARPCAGCRCVLAAGAEATEALPNWMMSGKLVELGYPLRAKASEQSLLIRNKPRALSQSGA